MRIKRLIAGLTLIAVFPAFGLTGCRTSDPLLQSEQNCLYLTKDGSLQWVSSEEYTDPSGAYREEELVSFAKEELRKYNEALGRGSENPAVSFVSAALQDGRAVLITEYADAQELLSYADEMKDTDVTFQELESGAYGELSQTYRELPLLDAKGNPADPSGEQNRLSIGCEGQALIRTESQILYVSEGCVLQDEHSVRTAPEGKSLILVKAGK